MQCPTNLQMQAAKLVLRYLKGTIDHGLQFKRDSFIHIRLQVHKGLATSFTFDPIPYHGHVRQPTVAKSSTEVEYRTIGSTTTLATLDPRTVKCASSSTLQKASGGWCTWTILEQLIYVQILFSILG